MSDKKDMKPRQNYGPGNVLRTKREEYEWSIEAVAEALHLSSDVVRSIEGDHYDKLPGATYVIGYWRSYARLVGIDLEETIDANKRNLNIVVPETPSLHMANAYHPVKRSGVLIWIGILALLVSLVYYSWQENFYGLFDGFGQGTSEQSEVSPTDEQKVLASTTEESGVLRNIEKTSFQNQSRNLEAQQGTLNSVENTAQESATPEPFLTTADPGLLMQSPQDNSLFDENGTVVAGAEVEVMVEEPSSEVLVQDGLVLSGNTRVEQIGAETETADNPAQVSKTPEDVTSEEAMTDNGPPEDQTNANSSGEGPILVLTLSKDSWLDIRDKTNKRLVYATEKAGDTIKVNGTPPFYLYIGTPSGVSLKYKGENMDFESHKSGLFARFKLDDTLEYL